MKVLLLADVRKIGKKYDVVNVSDGYALNFLTPKKLAVEATASKIKWAEEEKKRNVSEKAIQEDLLEKSAETLKTTVIEISGKVNEKGHLFAGLHTEDIAKELEKQSGISLDPELINIEKPIKEVGEYDIEVVSGDIKTTFKLIVKAL